MFMTVLLLLQAQLRIHTFQLVILLFQFRQLLGIAGTQVLIQLRFIFLSLQAEIMNLLITLIQSVP